MKKNVSFIFLALVLGYLVSQYFMQDNQTKKVIKESNITEFSFDKDFKRTYDLNYNSIIAMTLNNKTNTINDTTLKAKLNIKFIKQNSAKNNLFLVQLTNIDINYENKEYEKLIKEIYSEVFVLEMSNDGRIIESYFKSHDEDISSLKQFLGTIQTVLDKKEKYEKLEESSNGTAVSKYLKQTNSLKKQRVKFVDYNSDANDIKILYSNINSNIDKYWLVDLNANERLFTEFLENKIESKNKLSFIKNKNLDRTSLIWDMDDLENIINQSKNKNKFSKLAKLKKAQEEKQINENMASLDDLIRNLIENFDGINSRDDLINYLKLNEHEIPRVLDFLTNSDDQKLDAALIYVLEAVGTPIAQDTLMRLISSETFSPNNRLRGVIALHTVEAPTKESMEFLWNISETRADEVSIELANAAILALGTMSTNSNEEVKLATEKRLKDEYYKSSSDVEKLSMIVSAMGNADKTKFKKEIYSAIKHTNTEIRLAAVESLENENSKETKEVVTQMIKTENSVFVKNALSQTVTTLKATDELMKNVQTQVFNSGSQELTNYINYLHTYRNIYPENVDILKTLRYLDTTTSDTKKQLARLGYSR